MPVAFPPPLDNHKCPQTCQNRPWVRTTALEHHPWQRQREIMKVNEAEVAELVCLSIQHWVPTSEAPASQPQAFLQSYQFPVVPTTQVLQLQFSAQLTHMWKPLCPPPVRVLLRVCHMPGHGVLMMPQAWQAGRIREKLPLCQPLSAHSVSEFL